SWRSRAARDLVALTPPREIGVESGSLGRLGSIVSQHFGEPRRVALVVDGGVPVEAIERARASLGDSLAAPVIRLPGGEASKAVSRWEELLDALAAAGLDRHSLVIAIGGGATTDVAGFAAASYMRGVRWVAVPTTLIGMVDAAIGGKTGVNLASGKNL